MQNTNCFRRLPILAAMAALALLVSAPNVHAARTTSDIFEDVPPGGDFSEFDFAGPTGFGSVDYNQIGKTGDLIVTVSIQGITPNEAYTIFLLNGPNPFQAIAFVNLGVVNTHHQGDGNHTFRVSAAQLAVLSLGAAPGTTILGHIEIAVPDDSFFPPFDLGAGLYDAAGVNWIVH